MSLSSRARDLELIAGAIRSIPDYPRQGILFRDVTSLCEDAQAFALCIDLLAEELAGGGCDKVVCAEARGFVFGAALACRLHAGLVLVRKPGKLPRATIEQNYELEYGVGTLQMHIDSVRSGERVLLVDDLIATGGTAEAMIEMVRRLQGEVVRAAFVIDLEDLGGRDRLRRRCGVESVALLGFPGH